MQIAHIQIYPKTQSRIQARKNIWWTLIFFLIPIWDQDTIPQLSSWSKIPFVDKKWEWKCATRMDFSEYVQRRHQGEHLKPRSPWRSQGGPAKPFAQLNERRSRARCACKLPWFGQSGWQRTTSSTTPSSHGHPRPPPCYVFVSLCASIAE